MLAARDQENLVFSHQAGAAGKQAGQLSKNLAAKTPAARYPKTPLKVPLNDENASTMLGKTIQEGGTRQGNENIRAIGKGVKGFDKASLVTPIEPRTARAPLGNKTTNAKDKTGQPQGVKDIVREIEKSQPPLTVSRRPRAKSPQVDSFRLEIHNDNVDPLADEDVEYAPPRPKDLPYESDVFPDGVLTFEGLKPENRMKGYYDYYYDPVDDNGVSHKEKQFAEAQKRALEEGERRIKQDLDEFDWTVGDVPATASYFQQKKPDGPPAGQRPESAASRNATRPPSTIKSRAAASALAVPSKTTSAQASRPKPMKPPVKSNRPMSFGLPIRKQAKRITPLREHPFESAPAVSRSTLGYNNGRTALSILNREPTTGPAPGAAGGRVFSRSASTVSTSSDSTITPARYAQSQARKEAEDLKRIEFLSIFDMGEDDDGDLGGSSVVIDGSLDDDDFKLTVEF